MKTGDFNFSLTSEMLNESMFKKFGKHVALEKYTREQLEDHRNILRTRVHAVETSSGFNDLLSNESYQQDKHLLELLNTRIKEMLGEAAKKPQTPVNEKAVSKKQQQAAGIALAAKRAGKKPKGKGAAAQMAKMSTKELEKFAGTKHKGLPTKKKKKKTKKTVNENAHPRGITGGSGKTPDDPATLKGGAGVIFQPGRKSGLHYFQARGFIPDPFYFKVEGNDEIYKLEGNSQVDDNPFELENLPGDGIPTLVSSSTNESRRSKRVSENAHPRGITGGSGKTPDDPATLKGGAGVIFQPGRKSGLHYFQARGFIPDPFYFKVEGNDEIYKLEGNSQVDDNPFELENLPGDGIPTLVSSSTNESRRSKRVSETDDMTRTGRDFKDLVKSDAAKFVMGLKGDPVSPKNRKPTSPHAAMGLRVDPAKPYGDLDVSESKKSSRKAKPDYLDFDGDGDKKEPMKKALKDKAKGKKSPPPFKKKKTKVKESHVRENFKTILEGLRYYIAEDEEGKAKDITAGADMVNDFTSWMQRLGQYQTKSTIELADSIRSNFSPDEAERFKSSVEPAIKSALEALTASREILTRAVAVLAGEEQPEIPMGEPSEEMPEPELDSMNMPAEEDEFAASDAAAGGAETAGREKRESREFYRAQKLAEAHSIMRRLAG